MASPRRLARALLPGQRAIRVLKRLPAHYAEHEEFRDALLRLFEEHCRGREALIIVSYEDFDSILCDATMADQGSPAGRPEGAWIVPFVDALSDRAKRYGLDRLGKAFPPDRALTIPRGEDLLFRWCRLNAEWALHGEVISPYSLGWDTECLLPRSSPLYQAEARERYAPLGDEVRIEAAIWDGWDPRLEPRAGARKRLLAEAAELIDEQLDRIAAFAESRGLEFVDTHTQLERHVGWLFQRLALGRSPRQIAEQDLGGWTQAPTVYHATKRYADLLGIDLGEAGD
jgi:hypothetical protein